MDKRILNLVVLLISVIILTQALWTGAWAQAQTNESFSHSNLLDVSHGNITFTGNVTNDFRGYLIASNYHSSPWGSDNNISQLYVSFNQTYLFIGITAIVDKNSLMIFLSNNTKSFYGTNNMTKMNEWARNIEFSSPMNYFAAVYFGGLNSQISGQGIFLISSPLVDSNNISMAEEIPSGFFFGGSNNSVELKIPWKSMFQYGHSGDLVMNISTFIVGGSGPWVGTGIPYAQKGIYNNGTQSEFLVNNTIALDFGKLNISSSAFPVSPGNIDFKGNVTEDFNGHLIAENIHTTPWGSSNNISKLYVSYNETFLFIGIEAVADNNGLMIFLGNNTESNYGTFNITKLNVWNRNIVSTSSVNYLAAAWYKNPDSLGGPLQVYKINSQLNESNEAPHAVSISNYSEFSGVNSSMEIAIPWNSIFPLGQGGNIIMDISAFIIGSSGPWVGIGIPYDQEGSYNSGSQAAFIVNNTIPLDFKFFSAQFEERGLPVNTTWYLNLTNGQNFQSNNSTIVFNEPNGTYYYTIGNQNNSYRPLLKSGEFNITGKPFYMIVNFTEVKYNISFQENGLPPETLWFINLSNGQSFISNNSTILIEEPNGTYYFTAASSNKTFSPSPSEGSFIVNGTSIDIKIKFTKMIYKVTFIETGLKYNTRWFVNISNGQSYSSINNTIVFYESNGTFYYNIATNVNYLISPQSGEFIVYGNSTVIKIRFYELFEIDFIEAGLPNQSAWFLNLSNGNTYESNNSTIIAYEPNGTYSYQVASDNKTYSPVQPTGIITVNGSSISVSIKFTEITYKIFLNESGLPLNTIWYVNLSNGQVFSSNSTSIIFYEPNGSYSYSVSSSNKIYSPSDSQGRFIVNGTSVKRSVIFHEITYTITFEEEGLPQGFIWGINLSSGQSMHTSSSAINFSEPNGTYAYTVSSNNKSFAPIYTSGTFVVNGSNVKISISFREIKYNVTFIENGLPNNTIWKVSLNGVSESSNTQEIIFSMPNGSYTFEIQMINGYSINPSYGLVKIDGNSTTIHVKFSVLNYNITFEETGLYSTTTWSISLKGVSFNNEAINITLTSSSNEIIFSVPNGTYNYYVSGINGYLANHYSGNIDVAGAKVYTQIDWTILEYPFTIAESGLPNGTMWSILVTGREFTGQYFNKTFNSTENTIIIYLPNGTYSYKINLPTAYTGSNLSGSISIIGKQLFTKVSVKQHTNYFEIIAILSIVIIIIIIAIVAILFKRRKAKK